ncbi:hypothetical protein ABEF92_005325 [Exophiala dermatitidis]|uniref:Uncharacterized protein n=1 Tax=Exophiala dermatitidis (strain ATCC 34100 / CBS 525.76 / NIH/UT8656) TaxID=858893 RepID=H6BX02_EXODN|nr:uncharacterized protein HMPREF1120_04253 [Exophiala dermatitidis NIH/UT8656]EHY56158.1 hypothetical protein HMPREF1120_04253 [Exophiala dermatitidis NIH/UT8656]
MTLRALVQIILHTTGFTSSTTGSGIFDGTCSDDDFFNEPSAMRPPRLTAAAAAAAAAAQDSTTTIKDSGTNSPSRSLGGTNGSIWNLNLDWNLDHHGHDYYGSYGPSAASYQPVAVDDHREDGGSNAANANEQTRQDVAAIHHYYYYYAAPSA